MHYLHKILVYLPDAGVALATDERETVVSNARSYAESTTEDYYGQAFDWRETDSAGRWSREYPVNVLLASDDLERFISELEETLENQYGELQCCIAQLKGTVGTDLEKIAQGIWEQVSYMDNHDGVNCMTTYYLHCIAAYLYGEYRCDSCFYNSHDYTARLYKEDIDKVRQEPDNWALVMFDYHN